jgi:concanavalin A-like lectin/glucanase superfamily protein
MKKGILKKGLLIGVILLFFGASILPIISGKEKTIPFPMGLNDGLAGYWSFDFETAEDESGNNNHGTIHGAVAVDGISGKALDFDGINDYVSTSLTQSLSSNAFSVFLWAKDIPNGNKYIISQAHIFSPFTSDWLLGNPNHGLWFNDEKIDGNNQLSDGNWHHIGLIFDGIAAKLYIDGAQHNSSITPPEVGGVGPVVFMARADVTKGFVSGTIDEVRIYNRMLNENEIQELHNNPGNLHKTFIVGRMGELNKDTGNLITFKAANIHCIKFNPFSYTKYGLGEQIKISEDYKGLITEKFIIVSCNANI